RRGARLGRRRRAWGGEAAGARASGPLVRGRLALAGAEAAAARRRRSSGRDARVPRCIMRPVIGALIVTRGKLAYELLNAAQKIETNVSGVEAVPLEWTDTVDEAREKIRQALERISDGNGVIIFTDMF